MSLLHLERVKLKFEKKNPFKVIIPLFVTVVLIVFCCFIPTFYGFLDITNNVTIGGSNFDIDDLSDYTANNLDKYFETIPNNKKLINLDKYESPSDKGLIKKVNGFTDSQQIHLLATNAIRNSLNDLLDLFDAVIVGNSTIDINNIKIKIISNKNYGINFHCNFDLVTNSNTANFDLYSNNFYTNITKIGINLVVDSDTNYLPIGKGFASFGMNAQGKYIFKLDTKSD
jgi:hypothetical protein